MQSVYEKYVLKKVINAAGRMTILGVSTPRQEVIDSVANGLGQFFEMKALVENTGRYIASLLGVENAVVVGSASAGIAQSVAAVIIKDDEDLLLTLHSSNKAVAREIILPRGHNVNYGGSVETMVTLGGGKVIEVGFANECKPEHLASKITANTAAILYIKSHHCVQKSMLSVEEAAHVAKQYGVPLIVDAAAEEDLTCYYHMGADIVIYSGGKAIEGPTSGLVVGREQAVEWVKKQSAGIGRAMKVGKESILGLTAAIELYLNSEKATGQEMIEKMTPFIDKLNTLNGIQAKVVWDGAGRDIARTEIFFDEAQLKQTPKAIVEKLKKGDIAIYFREYKVNEGKVEVDVRSVPAQELDIIYHCIKNIVS